MDGDWGQPLLTCVEMEFLLQGSAGRGRLELFASSQEGSLWRWDGMVTGSGDSRTWHVPNALGVFF